MSFQGDIGYFVFSEIAISSFNHNLQLMAAVMRGNIRNNKPFVLLLSSASLVIWGLVVYQVLWGIQYDPPEPERAASAVQLLPDTSVSGFDIDAWFENERNLRNPFAPARPKRRLQNKIPGKQKAVPPVPEKRIPRISFSGFLQDREGKLAVLETENGDSRIVAEGDSLQGVRLISINERYVLISVNDEQIELPLTPN